MKVEPNQQRLKELLKETITLLCKNGLTYNHQFSVEGLIVITLDKDTIFHANINETVKVQGAPELDSEGEENPEDGHEASDSVGDGTGKARRKRKRKRSMNGTLKKCIDEDYMSDKSPSTSKFDGHVVFVKNEPDDSDIVLVKEELGAYATPTQTPLHSAFPSGSGIDPETMLSSQMHLPTFPINPNMMSSSQPQMSYSNLSIDASPSWTTTPRQALSQSSQPSTQQTRLKRRFPCHMCEKSYTDRRHLRSHLFSSHGCGEPLRCRDCGQVFKWRVSLTTHKSHCPFNNGKASPSILAKTTLMDDNSRARNLKFINLKPSDFQPNHSPASSTHYESNESETTGLLDKEDEAEELKEPLICIECGEVFKKTSSLLAHKIQCSQHFTPLEGPSDKRVHVTVNNPITVSHVTADTCI